MQVTRHQTLVSGTILYLGEKRLNIKKVIANFCRLQERSAAVAVKR